MTVRGDRVAMGIHTRNSAIDPVNGFTLVEILVAVVILAIALSALLQLHATSLRQEELTRGMGWAAQVAGEKMAETLAAQRSSDVSGEEAAEGFPGVLRWNVRVAPLDLEDLRGTGIRGLSEVTVRVVDPNGSIPPVELVTYAALRD